MYLDNSATTAVSEEVLNEMEPYFREAYGNPSTLYSVGREAKKGLDKARQRVADAINTDPKEIIFTSGGSESDNLAIKGIALKLKGKGNHIITSEIEHPAVKETLHFLETLDFKVTYLPVYDKGIVKVEDVKDAITPETILITIMHGNNEIGTLQPIAEIGKLARERKILFHTDAVQTFGKVKVDVEELNVDLLSLSSHKVHGPKGVGALYIKKGVRITPLIHGGGQERGIRSGTENVPGIVGFGKACEIANNNLEENYARLVKTRDEIIDLMCKRLYENNYVNENFRNQVYQREAVAPTCFSNQIAIPHSIKKDAKKSGICISVLREPILWNGYNVRLIFMFALNKSFDQVPKLYELILDAIDDKTRYQKMLECKNFKDFISILMKGND